CLFCQVAHRRDEGLDIFDGGTGVRADLDERRVECLCRLEQLLPMPAPVFARALPPAGAQFDFDMAQTNDGDLLSERFEADGLPHGPQVVEDEPEPRPSCLRDPADTIDRIERTALTGPHRRRITGARPTCGYQLWVGHCPSRSFLHARNRKAMPVSMP